MGSELPATMEEEREYLRCRWGGIHGLGLKHSLKAAELLEVTPLPPPPSPTPLYPTLTQPFLPWNMKLTLYRKSGDGRIKPKRPEDRRFLGKLFFNFCTEFVV